MEKHNHVLTEAYRSMLHQAPKLQVEEEMLMHKLYGVMAAHGLVKKNDDNSNNPYNSRTAQHSNREVNGQNRQLPKCTCSLVFSVFPPMSFFVELFSVFKRKGSFQDYITCVTPHMVLIIDKGSEVSLCQLSNTNSSSTATHDGTIYVQRCVNCDEGNSTN
ncbi:hypothetical protein HN51_037250 [Arachis hypogaea]